jgi:quercetin dioxygenase-like cupin family protein
VTSALPAFTSINLDQEYAKMTEFWSPRVVGQLNGQFVKLAKGKGELVWHSHVDEDELFICHKGQFGLKFRDRPDVVLSPGDMTVVPKGVEHFPYTVTEEAWVILFEPMQTLHTGSNISDRTRSITNQTSHLTTA